MEVNNQELLYKVARFEEKAFNMGKKSEVVNTQATGGLKC